MNYEDIYAVNVYDQNEEYEEYNYDLNEKEFDSHINNFFSSDQISNDEFLDKFMKIDHNVQISYNKPASDLNSTDSSLNKNKSKGGRPMKDQEIIIDEVTGKVYNAMEDPVEYRKARK